MTTCYIGIGSNLGDRRSHIERAIEALRNTPGVIVTRLSSIYETEPVSNTPQGKFLNGVIEIKTSLRPKTLLSKLNAIEDNLGRKRDGINMPRTIDLDILYYGNERIEEEGLIVPHPRIREREFVLKGLRELAPSLIR
ncbi:MAG: 2-amino-4-hydroxy-6-hydroxymethyldihydropteridine diphosphokinase [Candidatus Omnitrophica bacterium]|nr:2-amino-4-hydroxy-6-hydroxymethyldihydropteridine diphosphokinase [Candidatus Omnitrophota bacterium]